MDDANHNGVGVGHDCCSTSHTTIRCVSWPLQSVIARHSFLKGASRAFDLLTNDHSLIEGDGEGRNSHGDEDGNRNGPGNDRYEPTLWPFTHWSQLHQTGALRKCWNGCKPCSDRGRWRETQKDRTRQKV